MMFTVNMTKTIDPGKLLERMIETHVSVVVNVTQVNLCMKKHVSIVVNLTQVNL